MIRQRIHAFLTVFISSGVREVGHIALEWSSTDGEVLLCPGISCFRRRKNVDKLYVHMAPFFVFEGLVVQFPGFDFCLFRKVFGPVSFGSTGEIILLEWLF